MSIYGLAGGVNKEGKQHYGLASGVNKEIKEIYGVAGGVNKQVLKKSSILTFTRTLADTTANTTWTVNMTDVQRIYIEYQMTKWNTSRGTNLVLQQASFPNFKEYFDTPPQNLTINLHHMILTFKINIFICYPFYILLLISIFCICIIVLR